MKLKDCFNQYKNSKNNQVKFELKKRVVKENNINMKDLMEMDIPFTNKINKFSNF